MGQMFLSKDYDIDFKNTLLVQVMIKYNLTLVVIKF